MGEENMQKKPEIIVFAGPNGSGKSTITRLANIIEPYVNADDIKRANHCSDIEAAEMADNMRNSLVDICESFTFETVLSTGRNLELLRRAKEKGYFIRCIYVLTADASINVDRVKVRAASGGHDVPKEKIVSRYEKALKLLPQLLDICDVCHVYDNSNQPFRIFKKRKNELFWWENEFWSEEQIRNLLNI